MLNKQQQNKINKLGLKVEIDYFGGKRISGYIFSKKRWLKKQGNACQIAKSQSDTELSNYVDSCLRDWEIKLNVR